jgi:penicillin-insensitive murein DD-endopeptidase
VGSGAAVLFVLASASSPGDASVPAEEERLTAVPPPQIPAPASPAAAAPAAPSPPATPLNDLRARAEAFSQFRAPAAGKPDAIGSYSNGCLVGGVGMPRSGPGFEVMRPSRNRFFGHPALVAFIQRLAASAKKKKVGTLLIGDMAQARGGPTPTGHRSHQSGLDVDIGFTRPSFLAKRKLSKTEREGWSQIPVVDLTTRTLTAEWGTRVQDLIELAASDPEVARVFVHPRIKRELCDQAAASAQAATQEKKAAAQDTEKTAAAKKKTVSAKDAKKAKEAEKAAAKDWSWLRIVRPWWGHNDHLHVRLKCPADSTTCEAQEAMSPGDGCSELAWWESEEARRAREPKKELPPVPIPAAPVEIRSVPALPLACQTLLEQPPEKGGSGARTTAQRQTQRRP